MKKFKIREYSPVWWAKMAAETLALPAVIVIWAGVIALASL